MTLVVTVCLIQHTIKHTFNRALLTIIQKRSSIREQTSQTKSQQRDLKIIIQKETETWKFAKMHLSRRNAFPNFSRRTFRRTSLILVAKKICTPTNVDDGSPQESTSGTHASWCNPTIVNGAFRRASAAGESVSADIPYTAAASARVACGFRCVAHVRCRLRYTPPPCAYR